jgi:hypothetical protein
MRTRSTDTSRRRLTCFGTSPEFLPGGQNGVEPPRPRIEAIRIVDMTSSNAWAKFSGIFARTRSAPLEHEQAKAELWRPQVTITLRHRLAVLLAPHSFIRRAPRWTAKLVERAGAGRPNDSAAARLRWSNNADRSRADALLTTVRVP